MAFNLISCNSGLYPDILDIASPDLTAYVGNIVTIEDELAIYNVYQSYTVVDVAGGGTLNLGSLVIDAVPSCVPCVSYNSKISTSSDCCECSSIDIVDESTYVNSIIGHATWGYRKIVVARPDGTTYVLSSNSTEERDGAILPWATGGVTDFSYPISDTDVDGVYTVMFYSFPEWSSSVYYNLTLGTIVHRSNKLYKLVASNTGVDPALDTDETYWEEYTIDDSTLTTRYGTISKVVITCISLDKCNEKLLKKAFCSTEANPCASLCDNKYYAQAMKFIVTKEALSKAKCKGDWVSVQKMIEILKSICSCGGC